MHSLVARGFQPSSFLDQIVEEYLKARDIYIPCLAVPGPNQDRVSRGESRSIASIAEDLLAVEIARTFEGIDHIYVNQNLAITSSRETLRIKPDLTLCRNGKIILMIDLKMDLGYQRTTFIGTAQTRLREIHKHRSNNATVALRSKDNTRPVTMSLQNFSKYIYVAVSNQNISKTTYSDTETALNFPTKQLFTLIRGAHPNDRGIPDSEIKKHINRHASTQDLEELSDLINTQSRLA